MNLSELEGLVGRRGVLSVPCGSGALQFTVKIADVRRVYGRTDYLVRPVAGSGGGWVSADRFHAEPTSETD